MFEVAGSIITNSQLHIINPFYIYFGVFNKMQFWLDGYNVSIDAMEKTSNLHRVVAAAECYKV